MKKITSISVVSALILLSCSPEEDFYDNNDVNENSSELAVKAPINSSKYVSFSRSSSININSVSQAESVFGNDWSGSWESGVCSIDKNEDKLRITLPETAGSSNGITCRLNVADKDKYYMYFDVKFERGYDFSGGGKVGFGFAIGDGVTGGRNTEATQQNKGGSFRVMWRSDSKGVYFHPYVYYKDMRSRYGTDFKSFRYYFRDNTTYRIRLSMRTNSSSGSANGWGKMEVRRSGESSYTTVWHDTSMRWSGNSNSSNRRIKTFYFDNFRGGSNSSTWNGSKGDQDIIIDNLRWSVNPI